MRAIHVDEIRAAVRKLCIDANLYLPSDVTAALENLSKKENSPLTEMCLTQFRANREVAAAEGLALCQDTGTAVVFIELGQEVQICGGLLTDAVQQGVADGYRDGYLRKSIVTALSRINTEDNTPAVIHLRLVAGEHLLIRVLPKGGGAENMSRMAMLKPSAGVEGVCDFVVDTVKLAGANPGPPVIVGVGIGGNFESAPILAKQALMREIGSRNPDPELDELEQKLLMRINQLNIGVQGFGGPDTALAVFLESMPCHFASLPVAVNLNCHVARHQQVIL